MITSVISNLLHAFSRRFPKQSQLLAYKLINKDQLNVNLDLCNPNQKRILISYITLTGCDFSKIKHASYFHLNQIIHYFIAKGFCIDLCWFDDTDAYHRLKDNKYDVILGFGSVYKLFCKNHNIPLRICFTMENNPLVVKEKYDERIKYFNERHPNINPRNSQPRMGYFDEETFELSNYMILMNSFYNSTSFKQYFETIHLVNSNAIINSNYNFEKDIIYQKIDESRNNILWFGSAGIIHKGLDILIDVVAQMPNKKLLCYGICKNERNFFRKIKAQNTIDCGRISVLSNDFVEQVIYKNNICVFPSCSEGMSTAVATCMAHGIIPIVTKEVGFNDSPWIVTLKDYTVENIKDTINHILNLSTKEILQWRYECYKYARNQFSINEFDSLFTSAMDSIIEDSYYCYEQ